ncbi:MAG: MFS transporter [Acetobacteraceae bacterium]|nr:MFS transporter [Acetobacteraceae bacterium]
MSDRPPPVWTERGSPAYRRIALSLFFAGLATFAQLYAVQPLLPALSATFGVDAASSSLAVSTATFALAFSNLAAGSLSERWGRKGMMTVALIGSGVLTLAVALAASWPALLALRALQGALLGGAPAVAMAYLAEEIGPAGLGLAMGLYVAGTAFGGMAGRVVTGFVAEYAGWRAALGAVGVLCLAAASVFALLLPRSRNFVGQRGAGLHGHLAAALSHLRHPTLPWLYATGFLAMGVFVTIYNYAAFRLIAPPYALDQAQIGLIFTAYLLGMAASTVCGALVQRLGYPPTLGLSVLTAAAGVLITLPQSLAAIIAGIGLMTVGFFGMHTTASAWVGRSAREAKGQAAGLYLMSYYLGSSLMGSLGGWFWTRFAWPGVVLFVAAQLAAAMAVAVRLSRIGRPAS